MVGALARVDQVIATAWVDARISRTRRVTPFGLGRPSSEGVGSKSTGSAKSRGTKAEPTLIENQKRKGKTMKPKRLLFNLGVLGATCASLVCVVPKIGHAVEREDALSYAHHEPKARLSELAGSWTISLGGNTGCGLSAMYVTVDLDAAGSGMATIQGSSTGCAPNVAPSQPFKIMSLNPDGSGTAGLACGPGCGWSFTIQVPKGSNNLFTLVDVAPENPNNVLVGTAARKW